MKRLLSSFALVLMMCAIFTSCKDDDKDVNYPSTVTSGIWSGKAGTSFCDVTFIADKQYCVIVTTTSDKATSGTFEGKYTYDKESGLVTVNLAENNKASLQLNSEGTEIQVSFTSATNLGTYIVKPTTHPTSIAGSWVGKDPTIAISATLESFVAEDGMPCQIIVMGAMDLTGFYNYTTTDGTGTFKVSMPIPNGKITYEGTFQYNPDGTLTCKMPELEESSSFPANGIVLERLVAE